ncbi:hypothetical protein ACFONG_12240 [Uliginosibacterium paludis]|uniref:Uncharacterized protein n=1 Tax=Uliginosibacterium paludis TaxID=1615952 RepID=A0ABV2CQE6_9RHOO
MNESVYVYSGDLSEKSEEILTKIGEASEDLLSQLRHSPLVNIHAASNRFDFYTKIRIRRSRSEQTILALFNRDTADALLAEESSEVIEIVAGITRLNINTGNGRLEIIDERETVAFGFDSEYRFMNVSGKKVFSENLNHNNGLEKDRWEYLRLNVSPVRLRNGKVVKYIVRGF